MFVSRRIVVVTVLIVLLVGFVIFGLRTGEYSASGGSYGTGIWEPQRWMARKHGGMAENRADGYLTLSSGDLLKVPGGAELTFRYGGELEMSYVFDALAFEVNEGELSYGKDIGSLEVSSDLEDPHLPVVLPVK